MVFDTSRKLHDDPATTSIVEGVRRHDYLPFGEENVCNAAGGSRTAANGYLLNDGVRQQFVGYERDSESGLDFAGARYYANVQGRFTSPDIPFADQIEDEPQSWNLYSYVTNNPLKFSDPFGLWKRYKTGDDRVIYVADPGDTFEGLAEILQVPVDAIVNAFGTDKVVAGVAYDVSDYKSWKTSLQKTIEDIQFYQEQRRFHPIDIESPDPTSPWKSHYPGLGGIRPRTNPFSPNIMSQGRWLEIKEAARELANNVLKSGVGAGARSGQHGKPFTKAAAKLRERLKQNEKNWLPEFKEVIEKKIQEWTNKASTINEKIGGGGKQ
jgi:RHS repeat-associated protein